jgi:hypothetical protein
MVTAHQGRFYQYGGRLLFMIIVATMLCCVASVAMSMIARAMPYSVDVKSDHDDVADPNGDDYPQLQAPTTNDDALISGGSEIARAIDENIARYAVYNDGVQKLAASTFGAPMSSQAQVTRSALFEDDDDWKPGERAPDKAPTPMTREITFFNF